MARTQIDRPFRLKSPLGDDALLLDRFEGVERVSTAYHYILRVLAESPDIDMKGQLQKPVVLTIVLSDKKERHIHGNIKRMRLLGEGEDGLAAYEIEMGPWFWFLQLFSDCRIFQNKTIPEVIQQVFHDRGFSDFKLDTQATYPTLEYCVQYRETDFNFVSRLMEQEGISYYFEQSQEKATMVLTDNKDSLKACPHKAEARFMPAEGGVLEDDTVNTLEEEAHVHTGKASLRDYDFEKPATDLSATVDGTTDGEYYDYPGKYISKGDGDRYARVRLEEREARQLTLHAETNCMGLECGFKFTLKEHFREEANKEYAILALHHVGQNSSYRSNADPSEFEYANRIEAIPSSVPFRPHHHAKKPVIRGVQTAVVVGKSGEEIWTDKYGRVIVQFFWDRQGKDDEGSSCWVRVSQGWAGKNWGAIYTPRIGQEVIVSFLEGDPDRPIITGRVYNADQMPPYTLPGEQTKSTLKSMSSKGGGGFNEIRIEDKKGKEQIFVHGEKDLDVRVKSVRRETIGGSRHLTVGGDKLEKIGGDEHCHVMGNRLEKIEKDHFLEIVGKEGIKVSGDHSLSVQGNVVESFKGNDTLDVSGNISFSAAQIVIEAKTGITLKVGGNFVTVDPSGVSIKGTMVLVNSGGAALSGSPGSPVPLTAPTDPAAADDDHPGGVTAPPSSAHAKPKTITLTTISPSNPHPGDPDEPDRPVPTPGPGGGSPSNVDISTFPKDVDPVAIAAALAAAAASGGPLVEQCPLPKPKPKPKPAIVPPDSNDDDLDEHPGGGSQDGQESASGGKSSSESAPAPGGSGASGESAPGPASGGTTET